MRGEQVIARAFGGAAVVLRVWGVGDGVVYLASEAEFQKREVGRMALEPIGFPAADVFAYDETFPLGTPNRSDWNRLQRWQTTERQP
ncbi:MAG TPA: hypothetical protein VJT71_15105 [Pyrinomonadaceae bacterium]|nr:hypothetical protein [Pyrinomonadaceae bacterium]